MKITKQIMVLCSAMLVHAGVTGQEQEKMQNIELPKEWNVFYSESLTRENTFALRFEDESLLLDDGKTMIQAVKMPHAAVMDLAITKPHSMKNRAAVVGTVFAKVPQSIYIGMGADWWVYGYCNGRYFGGTDDTGNEHWPPAATDHVYKVPLRAGRNELVFYVRPGAGSWKFSVDFFEKWADPDIPPREMPAPGIAFGPYLTNPAATSVSITYAMNGRQPLELEYRPAGTTEWKKESNLRGGQITDEVPVIRFDLKNLLPDTVYEYRAILREPPEYRTGKPDAIHTFRTLCETTAKYSFFLMGDTQDVTKAKNLSRLQTILDRFPETKKSAFFVHVGDLHGVIGNFRSNVFDSLLKLIPPEMYIISARGNHEFEGFEAQKWIEYFPYKDGRSYGMFRAGEVCFLVLDTGHHLSADSDNCHQVYAGLNQLDTLLEEEKAWLRQAVKDPMFTSAKFRIVIGHVAPYGQNEASEDNDYMIKRLRYMAGDLFKGNPAPYPVDLWLAGHTHVYLRTNPVKDWNFTSVVVAGGGQNTEKRKGIALYFDVEPGRVVMKALNSDGTIHDTLEIKK